MDKISDLMYHAGLTAQGSWDEMDKYDQDAIMLLSLLIVQECVQVSLKNSHRSDDMGAIIAKQIKQHFGII